MRRISPAGSLVGLNTIPSRASSAPKVNEIVDDTARYFLRNKILIIIPQSYKTALT